MARRGMGCGIAVGAAGLLVLIIIIGAVASGQHSASTSSSPVPGSDAPAGDSDAAKDVRIDSCQVRTSSFGTTPEIKVTVTNHTDHPQSYLITVAVNDASGATRYGEAIASSSSLGAGQTAVLDAGGLISKPASGFVCSIARVDRLPV